MSKFHLRYFLLMFSLSINYLSGIDFSYNGSLTQTYVQTTGNQSDWSTEFPNTDEGSWKFTEVLLGGAVDITDDLRIGAQGISRVFGNYGNYDIGLDWGYADYRIADYFGLRAGKVKYAVGFYNESRDVDSARNSILLSQDTYPENFRAFINAVTGISSYGTYDHEQWGGLDYQFTFGNIDVPKDFTVNELLGAGSSGRPRFNGDWIAGGQLIYNAPWGSFVEGLRVGFSYSEFRGSARINDPIVGIGGPGDFDYDLDVSTGVFSLEYSTFDFTIGGEYDLQVMESSLDGHVLPAYSAHPAGAGLAAFWSGFALPLVSGDTRGYYLFGTYQLSENNASSLRWSRSDPKNANTSRDIYTVSHRYDLNEYVVLKAEYNQIYDSSGQWGLFMARVGVSF